VWLALVSRRHVHHGIAAGWFETAADDQVAFCRITQMGMLRLLTNRHAMGIDVLNQIEAWKSYRRLISDGRIRFLAEPAGIETTWHDVTLSIQPATNSWTDAYLHAFASMSNARVVSFDRGFSRFRESDALILRA
jgi:toxin-antitoxin system PIN domain toxin